MSPKAMVRSVVGATAAALLLVACANTATSNSGSGGGSPAAASSPTVSSSTVSGVGTVLVDSNGMTLYYYKQDSGGTSSCTGSCATAWPPLVLPTGASTPTAGQGIDASKLGTITRADGSIQVTYDGKPLYTYQGDMSSGEATGQGVGGFFAQTVSGSGSGGSGGSSGGGYHY